MDKATKGLLQRVSHLEKTIHALKNLEAGTPRKQDETRVGPQYTTEDKHDGGVKEIPLAPHVKQSPRDTTQSEKPWYKTLKGWTYVAQLVGVPVALAYGVITYYQWKDVRTNFLTDQRAWLTIRAVALQREFRIGEKIVVLVEIVNSGKTPAMNTLISGATVSRPSLDQALEGNTTGDPTSSALIGPNTTMTVAVDSSEPVTSKGQIDALQDINGTQTLYARGSIYYTDIFGVEQETEFCFKSRGEDINAKPARWSACVRGNSVKSNKRRQYK